MKHHPTLLHAHHKGIINFAHTHTQQQDLILKYHACVLIGCYIAAWKEAPANRLRAVLLGNRRAEHRPLTLQDRV